MITLKIVNTVSEPSPHHVLLMLQHDLQEEIDNTNFYSANLFHFLHRNFFQTLIGFVLLQCSQGISDFVSTVVDKMGTSLARIKSLGVKNILVENIVPLSCMPFTTLWVNGETGCVTNSTLDTETSLHDSMLQAKVNALNVGGGNIVMLDLTKALRTVFQNGATYGQFSEPNPTSITLNRQLPAHKFGT